LIYQFPAIFTETPNTKHVLEIKAVSEKNPYSVEMKQKSKCKRPNEIRGDKPWMKINLAAQD